MPIAPFYGRHRPEQPWPAPDGAGPMGHGRLSTTGRLVGGPSLVVPCVRGLGYRRRLRTLCGAWLAWAGIEGPGCCRCCSLVKVTISEAMSTSRMRLSDEVRFSWKGARLLSVCSRRFCTEPKVERASLTPWMAASMLASVTVVPKLKIVESTLNVEPEPKSETAVTLMVCPSSAPTWKVMALLPVSTAMPLNLVSLPIRLISEP